MNLLEFCKSENLKAYIINKQILKNNIENYNLLNDILKIYNLCYKISNIEFENLYILFSNIFIDDIYLKTQEEKEIIYDYKQILFNNLYNDQNKNYLSLSKEYINENNNDILEKYYYILSDLIDIYGFNEVKKTYMKTK